MNNDEDEEDEQGPNKNFGEAYSTHSTVKMWWLRPNRILNS